MLALAAKKKDQSRENTYLHRERVISEGWRMKMIVPDTKRLANTISSYTQHIIAVKLCSSK